MSRTLVAAALFALAFAMPVAAQDAAAGAAADTRSDGEKIGEKMSKFADDLQALEADAVAKTLTLNADEAAAFWPQFKAYQAEQRKIAEGQIAAVRQYADKFKSLSDAEAVDYIQALLERDQQVHDLRAKYLAQYTKSIGQRRAATVIHLSRKLGYQSQAKLSEVIPLVQ